MWSYVIVLCVVCWLVMVLCIINAHRAVFGEIRGRVMMRFSSVPEIEKTKNGKHPLFRGRARRASYPQVKNARFWIDQVEASYGLN